MGFLIFIITVIVIVVAVSKNSARKQREEQYKAILLAQAQRSAEIINNSWDIINSTKNLNTLQSRTQVIMQNINQLEDIERRGYRFSDKTSSYLRENSYRIVNERIVEMAKSEYKALLEKRDTYSSTKLLINALSKLHAKLIDYKNAINSDDNNASVRIKQIEKMINAIQEEKIIGQLKDFIEKADKEEFKGNLKKAKDLYLEALHFYKNNGGESTAFKNEIAQIERKVESM